MVALAYVFPPLSGLVAYFTSRTSRGRFHGLQAAVFGLLWPLSLYGAAAITPGATQAAFFVGAALWFLLLLATAFGKDPCVPGTGKLLRRWTAAPPA